MSESKTDTKDAPKDDGKSEGGGLNVGVLREMIRTEVTKVAEALVPGKKSTEDTGSTGGEEGKGDVKAEVARALASLKSKEDREKRDAEVDEMLAAYKKKPEETAPVERRRVEKIMGWGE